MNVLLDDNYDAKIADFGESVLEKSIRKESKGRGQMGTAGWAAPEVLSGKGFSKASDVFSFGIILWELLTWRSPSVMVTVQMLKEPSISGLSGLSDHPLLRYFKESSGFISKKPFQNPMIPSKTVGLLNINSFFSSNFNDTHDPNVVHEE